MVNPRKAYPVDPGLIALFERSGRTHHGMALETVVLLELERRDWEVSYVRTAEGFEVGKGAKERIDFLAHRAGDAPLMGQVCLESEGDEVPHVNAARTNPDCFVYIVDNVRQGDRAKFGLKALGAERLARLLEKAKQRSYTMHQPSAVQRCLDAYRAAFEAFDVSAIADLFSYPCQITSDAGEIAVTTVPTRAAWVPQIERLVEAYRTIGVRSAEFLELGTSELTPRLAQATVQWGLVDGDGQRLYDFTASYTLADRGEGLRISAIAHNEVPRLRAILGRQRPG